MVRVDLCTKCAELVKEMTADEIWYSLTLAGVNVNDLPGVHKPIATPDMHPEIQEFMEATTRRLKKIEKIIYAKKK